MVHAMQWLRSYLLSNSTNKYSNGMALHGGPAVADLLTDRNKYNVLKSISSLSTL